MASVLHYLFILFFEIAEAIVAAVCSLWSAVPMRADFALLVEYAGISRFIVPAHGSACAMSYPGLV
jgi:hypothetical protein